MTKYERDTIDIVMCVLREMTEAPGRDQRRRTASGWPSASFCRAVRSAVRYPNSGKG